MAELLAAAAGDQNLLDAWNHVRANMLDNDPDCDRVRRFEQRAVSRLAEIAACLRAGEWDPRPLSVHEIPKASGGDRVIAVPTLEDRVVERAVLTVVEPYVDAALLPWSFGYRTGLGVVDAVRAALELRDAGNAWAVQADFDDCFDRIPRWPVLTRLRELVPDADVVDLVRRFLDRPRLNRGRRVPSPRGRGLAQGTVLAPLLCNLYLDAFDRRLLASGHVALRFADDFLIPARTEGEAHSVLDLACDAARDLSLELEPGKTRVVSFDQGIDFLGRHLTRGTDPVPAATVHPVESTVYVSSQGALVRVRGDRLVVEIDKKIQLRTSLSRVRQVIAVGRVGFTTPLLHQIARHGIDLTLLDPSGGFSARLHSSWGANVEARRAQHRRADDRAASLVLARQFVLGKVANMRVALLKAGRSTSADLPLRDILRRLDSSRAAVTSAASRDALMGAEGSASRDYFRGLSEVLGREWSFTHRARRPPPDPVNAMLSFGYTVLTHEAVSACESAALDPYVGFLHTDHYGRPSLALDLMEEFRPLVVDAVVSRVVHLRQIVPGDFVVSEDPAVGCRLSDNARAVFLAAYERRMLTEASYRGGRRLCYRAMLDQQGKALARALLGDPHDYKAVTWR